MSAFTLLVGDALERLRELPDESVQTCVTSPPYFGLRDYGVDGQIGLDRTMGDYVARLVEVFGEVKRVLRDNGTLWLNLGDSFAQSGGGRTQGRTSALGDRRSQHEVARARSKKSCIDDLPAKNLLGIPWRVAFALQDDGWTLRQDIIWHKPNPMPESVSDRCTKSHEYVFLLAKSERYFYDADAIRTPDAGVKAGNGFAGRQGGSDRSRALSGGAGTTQPWQPGTGANARSVWTIATQPSPLEHFAAFPEELPRRCILAGSRHGDMVLDPFTGTGTTGVVALKEGRRFVGVELNPAYAEMAEQRSREVTPSLFLRAGGAA